MYNTFDTNTTYTTTTTAATATWGAFINNQFVEYGDHNIYVDEVCDTGYTTTYTIKNPWGEFCKKPFRNKKKCVNIDKDKLLELLK